MKRFSILIILFIVFFIASEIAYARGRTGSRRVYPGHGRGSHYVGGR